MIEVPMALWMSAVFNIGIFLGTIHYAWRVVPCLEKLIIFSSLLFATTISLVGDLDNLTQFDFAFASVPSLRSLLVKGILCFGFLMAEVIRFHKWMVLNEETKDGKD